MERVMVGFECDDVGDWVALLECGHRQHVRHRPPWQERLWVVTSEGRREHLGTPLECVVCDEDAQEGGDPACWAHKVCAGCGAVLDGGSHRVGCAADSS